MFCDWYLPGYKAGGPIQSCKNIVNSLSDIYDFYILTSDRDLGDTYAYRGIKADVWLTIPGNWSVWYASPGTVKQALIKELITTIAPDAIYLNSMFSFQYSLLPLWVLIKRNFQGRIILAPRGMLHKGAILRKATKKKIFLRLLDISGVPGDIHFHATDEQERTDISRYFKNAKKIEVVGNIPNIDNSAWERRSKLPGELKCIFISRIHPKKNLHTALELLMNLKEAGCLIIFDVYGASADTVYTNKCMELVLNSGQNIKINFKGPLPPTDLFETLRRYHLFILPTFGENFGHAIFEVMSAGCPVLISDQTPWSDIANYNGGWALPLNDKSAYLGKIKEVCAMDEQAFNKMSLAARNYTIEYREKLNLINDYSQLFG